MQETDYKVRRSRPIKYAVFLGISFLMISQNHKIRDRKLKYHKAHGLFPNAHTLPKIKEIMFDLFGSFNRIWQS